MDAQNLNYSIDLQHLHTEQFMRNKHISIDLIKQICEEQISKLGFNYYSYEGYYPACEEQHGLSNFPEQWQAMSLNSMGSIDNPVTKLSQNTTTPFFWQDTQDISKTTKTRANKLLDLAKEMEIHDGVCFPIHGAGAEWGMFNVAKSSNTPKTSLDNLQCLQLFALTVHESVKRATACQLKERSRQSVLSPRESECLDWIAAGKTAWETAKIIGITESTVSFHVRNTINKLNASNRAHAVALAMARSLINNPQSHKLI